MRVLGIVAGAGGVHVDLALVDLVSDGDTLLARIVDARAMPYDREIRTHLERVRPPARPTFEDVCVLDNRIGQAFAAAAAEVVETSGAVHLVCVAGQEVYRWVQLGATEGMLQLGQPAWIAERLGIPVVSDVAARDIAAGGQGEGLTSYLDMLVLGAVTGRPAGLDLGDVARVTVPRGRSGPLAYDLGLASALIDTTVRWATDGDRTHDADGWLAAAGTIDEVLLGELISERYYLLPSPRQLGPDGSGEALDIADVDRFLAGREVFLPDLVATVTALVAEAVALDVRQWDIDVLVTSGRGAANPTLMRMLRDRLPGVRMTPVRRLRVPIEEKTAVAYALLGWLTVHGLPAHLPTATGARGPRVLGTITPGRGPLRLPEPHISLPRALRFE